MTHTPTTTTMLIPTTVPVRPSSSTDHSLVQVRAQPPAPAPAPTAGAPLPLAMQMAAATRPREQVQAQIAPVSVSTQTHTQQTVATAGASVGVSANANNTNAGAGAGGALPSTPASGRPTGGPSRPSQMPHTHALSPVFARPPPSLPVSSASNAPPSQQSLSSSQQQQQHQHQRFVVPPAIAAFKVLQPAKELLEQTWAAAVAAVQQEFAGVHANLARSLHDNHALAELLQRMQGERMQALHALHNAQTELKQCMGNFQSERRMRVHLERRLAGMTQFIEKCTCGAAAAKKNPTTPTPSPLAVFPHAQPPPPSSAPPPIPPTPESAPVLALSTETRAAASPTPTPAPGSSPRTTTTQSSSSSPAPDATVRSSVRRREREEDGAEAVGCESAAPKRRRLERTPTPISASVPEAVDTREAADAPVPVDHTPIAQTPEPQALPPPPPQQPQKQPEDPKTSPATPRRKIGIQHIQLAYETVGSTLQCRMCLQRRREVDPTTRVAMFPLSAAYAELVGHCEREHDAALGALACMSPGEIAEMRQRLQAAQ